MAEQAQTAAPAAAAKGRASGRAIALDLGLPEDHFDCAFHEPLAALRRADAVLITKVPRNWRSAVAAIEQRLAQLAPGLPVFATTLQPTRVRNCDGDWQGVEALAGRRIFAFAGLGRPDGLLATLAESGAEFVGSRWFPDHHRYGGRDLAEVAAAAAVFWRQSTRAAKLERELARSEHLASLGEMSAVLGGNAKRILGVEG